MEIIEQERIGRSTSAVFRHNIGFLEDLERTDCRRNDIIKIIGVINGIVICLNLAHIPAHHRSLLIHKAFRGCSAMSPSTAASPPELQIFIRINAGLVHSGSNSQAGPLMLNQL